MTAKDCSILITFQKLSNVAIERFECKNYHSKRLCFYRDKNDNSIYLVTLALVDLDRKLPMKIESTFKNDRERIKQFQKFLSK